ncbi:uncharacterized protein LOC129718742 [Wyeomyia smithii]|uniref:uncharacterized protein LOC129718742 n=1 Tax=Wyeomyia smithii TaxID=174621 RepID=UPI0024681437|nr:uncharacterized protein LOC129718742 [Wyeomyia smithii]
MEIENLPNEILEKILRLLRMEDLENAALVCHSWKEIILAVVIPKNHVIHLKPVHPVTHQLNELPTLLSSQAMSPFPKYHYKITIPSDELPKREAFIDFFETCGLRMKSLSLQIMQLTENILQIFCYLQNLEELSLITESDNAFGKKPANPETYLSALKNLKSLKLLLPNYFLLQNASLLAFAPLRTLSLERFTVELHQLKPFLQQHAGTLRVLTVRVEELKPLLQFMNTLPDLKLLQLAIKSDGNEDDFTDALLQLFDQQQQLRVLKVGSELSLRAVAALPRKLPNLEELELIAESIHDCRAFAQLKYLRKLSMSLYDVRAWDETAALESVLDFSLSVTFPLISPAIFCSFPNMKRFYLEDVDDDTLMRDIIVVETLMRQVQDVEYLDLENYVLKEREILNDCVPRFDGLTRLRMLKYSCRDMSDASLLAMDLPELRELYLTHCPGVTFKGISCLVRCCPLIETLHVEYNKTGFNDDCVGIITKKLTRLRKLYLINLRDLTNESIESILTNCSRLRELTFSYCVGITLTKADAIEKLSSIKTLRSLIFS